MEQSEKIDELIKAVVKVQAKIEPVKMDAFNPFFESQYASLHAIWESSRSLLSENGLVVIQPMDTEDGFVYVNTTLAHISGQWIRGRLGMKPPPRMTQKGPIENDPQMVGQVVTYFRRYSLGAMLGIVTDEDLDGDVGQHEKKSLPKKSPPKEKKPQKDKSKEKKGEKDKVYWTLLKEVQGLKDEILHKEYYLIINALGKKKSNELDKDQLGVLKFELDKRIQRNERYKKLIMKALVELKDKPIVDELKGIYEIELDEIMDLKDQTDIFNALNAEYKAMTGGKELK